MTANAAAIWLNTVFAEFDYAVASFIYNLFYPAHEFFTPFFEFVSFLAYDGILLIIVSFILIAIKKTRRIGTAMLLSIAIGALLTNCCLKVFIARPRPFADELSWFYQKWLTVGMNIESDKSFPSGHTTAAVAFSTAIFLTGNRKVSWTAYIFALLMCIARIYLMVHFASDVLGGIIVGLIGGFSGTLIAVKLPYKWYGSALFYTPDKKKICDTEHSEDYAGSKKFGKVCPGSLGIYYSKGFRTMFVAYEDITKAFIRIREVQGDDFGPYQYFTFIIDSNGRELTDINYSDERQADALIAAINSKSSVTVTTV